MGVFLGGLTGGALSESFGIAGVASFNVMLLMLWAGMAITMKRPHFYTSYLMNVGEVNEEQAGDIIRGLSILPGVMDVTVIAEDGVAYLKLDKQHVNMDEVHRFAAAEDEEIINL